MKRVIITGACGRIGSVLTTALSDFEVGAIGLNLDGRDLRVDRRLAQDFEGAAAVVHLAWIGVMGPPSREHSYLDELPTDNRSVQNLEMSGNVLEAALVARVPRVILASSVQADDFYRWPGPGLLSPDRVPTPTGPYGAAKLVMEEQGRHYATRGLDVTCVRFGAVAPDDRPDPADAWERRVRFSHCDCAGLARACLEAKTVPGRFCVLYGVSENEDRVHDTVNPFRWDPSV